MRNENERVYGSKNESKSCMYTAKILFRQRQTNSNHDTNICYDAQITTIIEIN